MSTRHPCEWDSILFHLMFISPGSVFQICQHSCPYSYLDQQIPFLFVGKPSITENKLSLRILQICWEITFITHHRRMLHRVAICGWDWMDGTSGGRYKENITMLIITLECTSRQYETMTMRQLQVL